MTRLPFDPMKSAAMRGAAAKKARDPDAVPLSAMEERALIEAAAIAGEILADEGALMEGGTAARPMSVKQVNALVNQVLTGALPGSFFGAGGDFRFSGV